VSALLLKHFHERPLLQDSATTQNQWKMEKVLEVDPGKDGIMGILELLISNS
jgi:hypothetical protein